MKIKDLRDLSKDDILTALGMTSQPSTSERLLDALGTFGLGLLVGAGAALLLAPKSGVALRADLGKRFRNLRSDEAELPESNEAATASDEART
jgi:hypothetical protein